MSNRDALRIWIRDSLLHLPVNRESYFRELWKNHKLTVGQGIELDRFDEMAAKLACTALDKEIPCLLCLPDITSQRCAAMVATLLIKYAVASITNNSPKKKILFCGASTKFKHAIESTAVGPLAVSDAFSYRQLSGKGNASSYASSINSETLPELTCVYNPSEPKEIIGHYNPKVVIVDCGAHVTVEWLTSLLEVCSKRGIGLIGWTTNPFSKVSEVFEQHEGSVFFFPKYDFSEREKGLTELYLTNRSCQASVLQLDGTDVQAIDRDFSVAKTLLRPLSKLLGDSLVKKNALQLCWTYLKGMETLTVPLSLFNAEAKNFWGIHSLQEYPPAIEKYIASLCAQDGTFKTALIGFLSQCNVLHQKFSLFSPYWSYLTNICLDKDDTYEMQYWLFAGKAQKQIFIYALLSRTNISETELMTNCNIKLATFKEFANKSADEIRQNNWTRIKCLVLGLPNSHNQDFFSKILKFDPLVVLYPNQLPAFKGIIGEFNRLEKERLRKTVKTIKRISGRSDEVNIPAIIEPYGLNGKIQHLTLSGDDALTVSNERPGNFTGLTSLQEELEMLFTPHSTDDVEDELPVLEHHHEDQQTGNLLVDKAISISFEQEYSLFVGENEKVNVIKPHGVESLFVRSIRVGDRLMVVHNTSRQNLYDLILSRVHDHPSLEFHMGMLRKWREDFYEGYLLWKRSTHGNNLSVFLELLQEQGSSITSTLAISNWLDGTTLRPQDSSDIQRIGAVLDLKFIRENYRHISDAASRIAGMHSALARKLNALLNRGVTRWDQEDMEMVDETIGLTIGELRSSIKILTITAITTVNSPLLLSDLGNLQKAKL